MSTEAIALLKSIDATLKQLLALSKTNKPIEIAPDADLDGQWGDPIVKAQDPRDWTGPSQKGKHFSECSSEYLELVAKRLDFFADKAESTNELTTAGKPKAPYNRRDAARARGWAKRIREGWRRQHAAVGAPEMSATDGPEMSATDGWADQGELDDSFDSGEVNWS